MTESFKISHIAIVGAGPAGLGAALAAREANLRVTVIDDQLEPGGQIWRAAGSSSENHANIIGPEYKLGRKRVKEFLECGATYHAETTVWHIEYENDRPVLLCSGPNGRITVRPDVVLLATGAVERPVPVPGWTLPGVMTAGGLQTLLKSARLVPDKAILAGAGPLLWLLASQMVEAKTPPLAVVDCVAPHTYLSAARYLPAALRNFAPLKKGLGLISKVKHAGVPIYRGAKNLRIEGDSRVRALEFQDWRGHQKRIEAETIGLHAGVVPNQQAGRLLRINHIWDESQHAFRPERDENMRIGDNLYIAGDGAGIRGAEVAWLEGQLMGKMVSGADISGIRKIIDRASSVRPFIDRLYLPEKHLLSADDDTLVCRCEAVTAGRVREALRDGAMGPNQVKFMLRPGMGPCQGRVCGLAITELVAETLGTNYQEAGYFRIRPPLKPVPLGVISSDPTEES